MFEKLYQIASKGVDLNMVISSPVHGKLTISVLPKSKDEKLELNLKPLVISGTPEELNAGFLDELEKAGKSTAGLMSNLAEYQEIASQAKENAKKDAEKAVKPPANSKAKAVLKSPTDKADDGPKKPSQEDIFADL